MQRIDVASAVGARPAPAAAGQPGYFSDGDPVGGTPATVVPADFLNMLQEELMAVVLAAGLAPSKATLNQLLSALVKLFGVTGNFQQKGHLSIPAGGFTFIVNWDQNGLTTDNTGTTHVTFDQPYPTRPLFGIASNGGAAVPTAFHNVSSIGTSGMDVHSASSANVAAPAGTGFIWLSFGI